MNGKATVEKNEKLRVKFDERCITLFDHSDKEQVVMTARHLAAEAGFDEINQFLIATAASELATNIVKYAKKGEVILKIVQKDRQLGIQMIARDDGPGIKDIAKAMQDNFSTSKDSLGLGLPSVKRIMDEFKIESQPGHGTTVSALKWRGYVKS
jgi:serine/threonine-protein kinase RsbT